MIGFLSLQMKYTTMNKLLAILSVMALISCGSSQTVEQGENETTSKSSKTEKISNQSRRVGAEEFKNNLEGSIVVDVRTEGEYAGGFIANAANVDFMKDDFLTKMEVYDKNEKILIYCQAGGRSANALDLLKENGFNNVLELEGGYGSWPHK